VRWGASVKAELAAAEDVLKEVLRTAHASTRSFRRRGVQDVDIDNVREPRGGRGGCQGARLL